MILQTNDTDFHQHVRKRFIELQTAKLLEKVRGSGGGLADLTKQENIDIMAQVMSNTCLHLQACKGYKLTGTTVALDGSEDDMICREAKDFWDEMGMRSRIDSAVAEIAVKHASGALPWTYKNVQSLITPYPRRGHLDEVKIGQEDEATADPEGLPWETDDARKEDEEAGASGDDDADCHGKETEEFDPGDWVDPDEAVRTHKSVEVAPNSHGDGDEEKGATPAVSVEDHQAERVIQESSRMRSLNEALEIFQTMNSQLGASLAGTVTRVIRDESRRHKALARTDAVVHDELRTALKDEEADARRARLAFQEHMAQERENKNVSNVSCRRQKRGLKRSAKSRERPKPWWRRWSR